MFDKKEKNQEKQSRPSEMSSCMETMSKMMGQSGEDVNCESIIAQFMGEDEIPDDWLQQMSRMTGSAGSCCGATAETRKE